MVSLLPFSLQQRQSNTPKKSIAVSSFVPSKKSDSIVVYVPHARRKTQQAGVNLEQPIKSDSLPKNGGGKSAETQLTYTNKSLNKRWKRQNHKKKPKDTPKEWQRGQQLIQRQTSDACSSEQWQRAEALKKKASGVPVTGSQKTLHRRYQRIKARNLKRAESDESQGSTMSEKQGGKMEPKPEQAESKTITPKSPKNDTKQRSKTLPSKQKKPYLASETASSGKVQNAGEWNKPLKLEIDVEPKEKQQSPKEMQESPKKEPELSKEVPKHHAIVSTSKTPTPPSKVPVILAQVNSHTPPPRFAILPTNTYPRVTPLPIHTYPSRGPTSPTTRFYDSLLDWQVSPHHVIAMDCEMVGVGEGGKRSMLARVSLVDWDGNVLVDTFVAPTEHVTDYRTFVSGIYPHHLVSPQAMNFQACRTLVLNWLIKKPILVGHGLVNDLEALRLTHPWYHIRDSATYLPFTKPCCRGACPKRLRDLASEELGISIQRDGDAHCSVVDARTVMELYKRKQVQWDLYVRTHRNYALNTPLHALGRKHSM